MNYQLIILPNPILVSDEEIKKGDMILCGSGFIHPFEPKCRELGGKKVIAGLPELPQLDLSLVDVGYVDVEKLTHKHLESIGDNTLNTSWEGYTKSIFKAGFNANPKKYTEADMIEFYEWCDTSDEAAKFWRLKRVQPSMDGSHNALIRQRRKELFQMWLEQRQPKVYNVEVEMEELFLEEDSMNYTHEKVDVCGSKWFPKITNNTIKVTKILP